MFTIVPILLRFILITRQPKQYFVFTLLTAVFATNTITIIIGIITVIMFVITDLLDPFSH